MLSVLGIINNNKFKKNNEHDISVNLIRIEKRLLYYVLINSNTILL